jgi:hypothetical protein
VDARLKAPYASAAMCNLYSLTATSFCKYADTKPRKTPKWFALDADRPLFAFAGLWTPWRGVRGPKSAPVEGQHELFDLAPPLDGISPSSACSRQGPQDSGRERASRLCGELYRFMKSRGRSTGNATRMK